MRTVHHTYRRKAKFPKELLSESSDPTSSIEPLIYGAKPKLSSIEPIIYGAKPKLSSKEPLLYEAKPKPKKGFSEKPAENIHETTIATPVLEPTPGIKIASLSPKSIKTMKTAVSTVNKPKSKNPVSAALLKAAPGADVLKAAPGADVLKAASTVSAEIIKQELGLSSGITLQKVKRTSIPPTAMVSMVPGSSPGISLTQLPKLSYHGPKIHAASVPSSLTQTYGSISLTPIKRVVQESTIVKLTSKSPTLVNAESNSLKSLKLVPIPNLETVKRKKEIPTLLPLKKIH